MGEGLGQDKGMGEEDGGRTEDEVMCEENWG